MPRLLPLLLCALAAFGAAQCAPAQAQEDQEQEQPLHEEQRTLHGQYEELTVKLRRLAFMLQRSQPRQAARLRRALDQAREEEVDEKLLRVVDLLQDSDYSAASLSQSETIDALERGLSESSGAATELHRRIAVIYAELHLWELALEHIESALADNAFDAGSLYAKAMVLAQKGDRQEALALYRELLGKDSENAGH